MFADSLCDSTWANRTHRGWTTLASFAAQTLAVGLLLALPLPLLYTQGLPQLPLLRPTVVAPTPPPAPAPPTQAHPATMSNLSSDGRMIAPPSVPDQIRQLVETAPPAAVDAVGLGVRGGTGDRWARNSVFNSIGADPNAFAPPPPPAAHRPPISRMMEGNLIHRVQPEYPLLARQARIEGAVVLQAVISRDGAIENLRVVSGHPLLVRAAADAVRQWRYRPYSLNGEAVEVETQVTVIFRLSGG
jgi:protein TonB